MEVHKADVVTGIAPDCTTDVHAGNPCFFTFRIRYNMCLVRHVCFLGRPTPCGEIVVQVVDDACDDMESNSADELVAPRKIGPSRCVATMWVKLALVGKFGRLQGWSKVSHCFEVLGVKLQSCSSRRQAKDIGMQRALPLLPNSDAFVPETYRFTWSAGPPISSQPSSPIDDTGGVIV